MFQRGSERPRKKVTELDTYSVKLPLDVAGPARRDPSLDLVTVVRMEPER